MSATPVPQHELKSAIGGAVPAPGSRMADVKSAAAAIGMFAVSMFSGDQLNNRIAMEGPPSSVTVVAVSPDPAKAATFGPRISATLKMQGAAAPEAMTARLDAASGGLGHYGKIQKYQA